MPRAKQKWSRYNQPAANNWVLRGYTDNLLALQPIFGNITFHQFSAYVSGAIAIFAAVIALFITIMHASYFSHPKRQKQYVYIWH